MSNIVQFSDLEKCKSLGLKSPILILQDESSIKASLLIEELGDMLKPTTMVFPKGRFIWSKWTSNGTISCYDDSAGGTKTTIIQYPYSEVSTSYSPITGTIPVNFDLAFDKSCYITCKEGSPVSLFIYTGTVSKLDLSACPSIRSIYFNGPNTIDTDILDLRNLFNFNTLNVDEGNSIKIILGYSKLHKKYYILSNFTHGRIMSNNISNIIPFISPLNPYNVPTPFYMVNYLNEQFTENELQIAADKNIIPINVR